MNGYVHSGCAARLCAALALLVVTAHAGALPALPGEPCATPAPASWSAHETWAWEQRICVGRTADFGERDGVATRGPGRAPRPASPEGWTPERTIRSAFLETVLLHEPFASAVPRQGVRLVGVRLIEALDLRDARLQRALHLVDSRLEGGVHARDLHAPGPLVLQRAHVAGVLDLARARIAGDVAIVATQADTVDLHGLRAGGSVFLDDTRVTGPLILEGAKVEGGLLLRRAVLAEVRLRDVRVGMHLVFHEVKQDGALEADNIRVGGHLVMRDGTIGTVDLNAARLDNNLILDAATVNGPLRLESTRIGGNLLMRDATFAEVGLRGARVGGQIAMDGSRFDGEMDMDSLQAGESLLMQGAHFQDVALNNADVAGVLNADGVGFDGFLNADALRVDRSAYLRSATFDEVSLRGVRVGGQLELNDSTVAGTLNLDSVRVDRHLFIRDADLHGTNLVAARVGHGLDLSGSTLGDVELSSARVGGEMRVGSAARGALTWRPGAGLRLRNLTVGALQDNTAEPADSWPRSVEFEGFVYGRLGGFSGAPADDSIAARPARWFVDWLARDPTWSPQPYRQLAAVLEEAGEPGKASDVRYAGSERARRESHGAKRLGLTLLDLTIGYGHGFGYFRALWWVAAFVALGALVLHASGEARRNHMPYGIAYSLDMLLPIIRLRDAHYGIDLKGGARYYFYLHKAAGYVLASFLLAGLAGLTK